jgi:hypothetical protein
VDDSEARPDSGAGSAPEPCEDHRAARFIDAATSQVARATGSPGTQPPDPIAERIAGMIRAVEQGDSESVRTALSADPVILAAFFQNVDLLYTDSHEHADVVSMVILEALHHATEKDRDEHR